jgi:hypothetical protein
MIGRGPAARPDSVDTVAPHLLTCRETEISSRADAGTAAA